MRSSLLTMSGAVKVTEGTKPKLSIKFLQCMKVLRFYTTTTVSIEFFMSLASKHQSKL